MKEEFTGPTVKFRVQRVGRGRAAWVDDIVTTEEPMEIRVVHWDGGIETTVSVSVTMRTPGHDYELAAGFLYSEGIIEGSQVIERVSHCQDPEIDQHYNIVNVYFKPGAAFDSSLLTRNFYTTSSCGVCGKASLEALELKDYPDPAPDGPRVPVQLVYSLPDSLREGQRVFDRTGGLHAAGLFDVEGNLVSLREDVGRHNAVDKVVGQALLSGKLPLADRILVVSGRTSFEIMQKALAAGIPVVVAVGAPSSLAVDIAQQFGMTLIGFAKKDRFNVYAGEGRLVGLEEE